MGSEKNEGTRFPPAERPLCANGCGFFGTPSDMNLCSKCYRDLRAKEENEVSAKYAMGKTLSKSQPPADRSSVIVLETVPGESGEPAEEVKVANRCFSCRKKVGLTGFKCKCGDTFCATHRYAEKHDCQFDFKGIAREAIANANPKVNADKIDRF